MQRGRQLKGQEIQYIIFNVGECGPMESCFRYTPRHVNSEPGLYFGLTLKMFQCVFDIFWAVPVQAYKASTTLSLDLCPEFMRDGGGAGLVSISQQFLPILEGISVEKSKLR